jgi:hypothetical protein
VHNILALLCLMLMTIQIRIWSKNSNLFFLILKNKKK